MAYEYYLKLDKTLTGIAFHSFSSILLRHTSLENPPLLGNFYHTINLKAKTSVMKKNVRRAWENDTLITVWEE